MAVAILDIDGTLVDTNYQHAIAWYRAFHQHEIVLPIWRIHRHIGMGGDQMVAALTDEGTEHERGDDIRSTEKPLYFALIEEVSTMDGSRELVERLKERGHTVILASSAKEDELNYYLDLLDARELVDGWTSSADVEATKPEPDLVRAALDKAGHEDGQTAVMVGDTPWDIIAAKNAGVPTLAVRTGGFGVDELNEAGAAGVFESVRDLCDHLAETALA
ncbi:MAG: HAD family hydrolase [Solirubrobacterales bacterium]|nr:HAD family hydrolase [Solirubrobacterales bacterium]MBV9423255.1 HAD family hydrolase [Solirubrobacterales bacterium]MBV9797159.1 HAD family hydrolase [Solirubrobacterales bacterium]